MRKEQRLSAFFYTETAAAKQRRIQRQESSPRVLRRLSYGRMSPSITPPCSACLYGSPSAARMGPSPSTTRRRNLDATDALPQAAPSRTSSTLNLRLSMNGGPRDPTAWPVPHARRAGEPLLPRAQPPASGNSSIYGGTRPDQPERELCRRRCPSPTSASRSSSSPVSGDASPVGRRDRPSSPSRPAAKAASKFWRRRRNQLYHQIRRQPVPR